MAFTLTATADSNRLLFANGERSHMLHPMWLRERTSEEGAVDSGSLQRLYVPSNLAPDVSAVSIEDHDGSSVVTWSDGHVQTVVYSQVAIELGWAPDPVTIPAAIPWSVEPKPFPRCPWPASSADLTEVIRAFCTHGFVILTGTPTVPGSLEELAGRFGVVRATNFGLLFDVFSKPKPVDLAYTPRELTPHTDNPYRSPVPGIQFLHCLENDATGGESTLVDGLAAFNDYGAADPEGHKALCDTTVTYRYRFGDQHLESRSPILETDLEGRFIGIRNSDRLDFVDPVDPERLEVFYRARARLRTMLNDPSRRAMFLLNKGDLMMMDNRRLLHGRLSYELESGARHLQGCYIEHDGLEMLWRKLHLGATAKKNGS